VPYAVLVSALGAIVSTAFAMFGLHSWSAMKFAPVVGAILGLIFGIATLRLRALPLRATLEEYRAAGGGDSGSEVLRQYRNIALGAAIVVSILELPVFLAGWAPASGVLETGLVLIIAYTFYRAWRSNDPRLFNIDFDAFNIAGGVGVLLIFGFMLYAPFAGQQGPMLNVSAPDLVKGALAYNGCAAFLAVVIAVFGLNIAHRILELISPQRH
jgi:hypothetical protein